MARYLRWINYRTRVFCLARYRQDKYGHKQAAEFFDTSNQEFTASRMELLACALEDAVGYLNRGGEVAILDGTNVTRARRQLIIDRLKKEVRACCGRWCLAFSLSLCRFVAFRARGGERPCAPIFADFTRQTPS